MKYLIFLTLILLPAIQSIEICGENIPFIFNNSIPNATQADCNCLKSFYLLDNACSQNQTNVYCYNLLNTSFYSGHNINDLGDYVACTNYTEYNNYVLAIVQDPTSGVSGYTGLCVPANCSAASLSFWSNFSSYNISGLTFNLTSLPINTQYEDLSTYPPEKDWIMVLAFVVIGILVLLNFFGLCLTPAPEESYQKQKKEISISANDISILRDPRDDNSSGMEDHSKIASKKKDPAPKQNGFKKLISCFDVKANYDELISDKRSAGHDDNLYVFNGVRFLAFCWVVFGHTWEVGSGVAKNPLTVPILMEQSTIWLNIYGAFYAVDIFFFLSGFLAAYLLIGKVKKMRFSVLNFFKIFIHRFIRIWPAYVFCILIFWRIAPLIGNGPIWFMYVNQANQCDDTAWKNMLFIDNIARTDQENYCFLWGWYLACDFQIFLIVPIICWIYDRDAENGRNFIWFCFIVSLACGYASAISANYYYAIIPDTNSNFLNSFYTNPFVRATPYLIGTYLGIAYKRYKTGEERNFYNIIERNLSLNYIVSFLGLSILLFIVYFPKTLQNNGTPWSQAFGYTWSVLDRPVYVFGLFLFFAPVLAGNFSFLKSIFACGFFTLMAKLAFTAYLVHLIILEGMFFGGTQFVDLEDTSQIYITLACVLLSLVLASFIHLMVEKPFSNLETKLLNPRPKPKEIIDEREALIHAKISVQDTN